MQGYFIKTISEVLRNHTIDHKASSIYLNCVQTPLSLIKRQTAPWHSWTSNCASIECLKRNRTSRILCGQATFYGYICNLPGDKHNISVFPHPCCPNMTTALGVYSNLMP